MDPVTRRTFWTHISGLVAKRVTVMVTTHFMDEAKYRDRVTSCPDGPDRAIRRDLTGFGEPCLPFGIRG